MAESTNLIEVLDACGSWRLGLNNDGRKLSWLVWEVPPEVLDDQVVSDRSFINGLFTGGWLYGRRIIRAL